MKLPSSLVWVERAIVLVVQVAAGVSFTATSQEHTTAGIVSVGGITLAQIIAALFTHLKTIERALDDPSIRSIVKDVEAGTHTVESVWDSLTPEEQQAARDAGKAL